MGAVALVGRHEAVEVTFHDGRAQPFVVLHGFLAVGQVVAAHVAELDVEAELAHHGHVGAELDAGVLVPRGDVRAHRLGGVEERVAVLDEQPLQGVGVVAGPEFGEVLQRLIVDAAASAGAEHHRQVGVFGLDAVEHLVEAAHVVHVEVGLLVLQVGRVDVGDGAVAVPLEIGDARVLGHQPVHYAEHEVLDFRVGQVEHHLVAEVVFVAVGQMDDPVLVLLVQFAFGIDHFRFDPDAELDVAFGRLVHQFLDAVGQLVFRLLPVAQPLGVAVAFVLVAEPSVVEQEHVHAQFHGVVHQADQFVLVEVESRGFPVVQQGHAVALPVLELVFAGPVVEVAAGLSASAVAVGEVEVRRAEGLALGQLVFREIRVDAGDDAQVFLVVHLEGETEVAGPAQRAEDDFPFVLRRLFVEREDEHGRGEHVGARTQLGVEHLLAEVERRGAHGRLINPVAGELGEVVGRTAEVEHGGSVAFQLERFLLLVADFGEGLDDVLLRVGHVVQLHRHGILVVLQGDDGLVHSRLYAFGRVRHVFEQQRGVGVVVAHLDGRLEIVFHAVGQVGFRTLGQVLQVAFVGEPLAQVRLVEPSPVFGPEYESDAVRVDLDELIGGCRGCQREQA